MIYTITTPTCAGEDITIQLLACSAHLPPGPWSQITIDARNEIPRLRTELAAERAKNKGEFR